MAKVIGFETLTVADTAVGPSEAELVGPQIGDVTISKGVGANYALFGPLETAQIRFRDDGTAPTTSVGHLLEVGDTLIYDGDLNALSFIRTGATSGSLPATYYRRG